MENKKTFCEECRDDVAYTVTDKQMKGNLKGEAYSYLGKEAHCANCGSEVFTGEINDYNLQALYDVYRKKNHIVSLE